MIVLILTMVSLLPLAIAVYFLFFSEQEQLDVDEEMRRLGVTRSAATNRPLIEKDPDHFERVKQAVKLEVRGGVQGFSFHQWLEENGVLEQEQKERVEYGVMLFMALGAVACSSLLGVLVAPLWLVPGFTWGSLLGLGLYFAILKIQFEHTKLLIRQGIPFLIEELIIAMERTNDVWVAMGSIAEIYRRRGSKNPVALLLIQGYEAAKRSGKLEEELKKRAKKTGIVGVGHLVSALSRLQRHGASYEVELRMIADEAMSKLQKQSSLMLTIPFTLEERLRYCGYNLTAASYYTIRIVAALLCGLLTFLIMNGVVLTIVIGLFVYIGSSFVLDMLIKKRADTLQEELPMLLTFIQQKSRQNLNVTQALLDSRSVLNPRGALFEELSIMEARIRSGAHEEQALFSFANTYAIPELNYVIHALILHRTTGGGLTQILEKVQRRLSPRRSRIQSS